MKQNILYFVVTFVLGATVALVVRSVRHQPYAETKTNEKPVATVSVSGTVNSICPICGMDVDPSLPPAEYKGEKVGFGCAACPPVFAKDPDRYGPSALKNVVVE